MWHPLTPLARQTEDKESGMGWLRLVGFLKLDISCAEYSLFYRALLQKRPIILRSLLLVAPPDGDGCIDILSMKSFVCHNYFLQDTL